MPFGRSHFRNEIIWCYTGPGNVTRYFKKKHDTILWYSKDARQWTFNADDVRRPFVADYTPARGLHGAHKGGCLAGIHLDG